MSSKGRVVGPTGSSERAAIGAPGYSEALAAAKAAIQAARTRAVLAVNSELISLYWDLGRLILDRQDAEGYGARVIARLSSDLRQAFPSMRGLSPGNLDYMRRLAAAWPDREVSLRVVGNVPWGHNQTLLDKLDNAELRSWYAGQAVEFGWSRAVLEHQIMSGLHRRVGNAASNFERVLPAGESELVPTTNARCCLAKPNWSKSSNKRSTSSPSNTTRQAMADRKERHDAVARHAALTEMRRRRTADHDPTITGSTPIPTPCSGSPVGFAHVLTS